MHAIKAAHAQLRQSARTLAEYDAIELANWCTAAADKLLPIIDPSFALKTQTRTSAPKPAATPKKAQSAAATPTPPAADDVPTTDPSTLIV